MSEKTEDLANRLRGKFSAEPTGDGMGGFLVSAFYEPKMDDKREYPASTLRSNATA